ncbi:acyl-CoA desaturase [Actinopolymorpha sp. NPDC004070]|uniref:fatty acid desaturase family protein n=1 Tax=Actinopolymorpha sp. NPDC004070 TaxID=3154548 RepID=UPI0033B28F94
MSYPSTPMSDPRQSGSDYANLTHRVREAGLLTPRPAHYAVRITAAASMLLAGGAAFVLLGDSWWQILLAVVLAVVFAQVAFVTHDIGHRQVFTSKRAARRAGILLGNLGVGLSYGWWIGKHNRHHANPNHVGEDPDVSVGGIAWSPEQAAERRGFFARTLTSWQAYLFFPMLLLEGLGLYVSGVRALWRGDVKDRSVEGVLLAVHTVACMSALFLVLSPGKALVFLAVNQGLFGLYMGCSFAPNHKGMPLVEEKLDFVRKQVLTSRNVHGGWFVDRALGGLNYQIEHHLFPTMPMTNLSRAQPLVQAFCEEHGISYHKTGLVRSYREALAYLHSVGAGLRASRRRPVPARVSRQVN